MYFDHRVRVGILTFTGCDEDLIKLWSLPYSWVAEGLGMDFFFN